jgi:hypothetical protein
MLGLILIAAVSASPPVVPSPHPAASVGASVSKTVVASPTLAPVATPTLEPTPSPAPSRYAPAPNTIVTTCKPAPEPDTDAQRYLYSILTPEEACFAFWIVMHESSWHVDSGSSGGPCGLFQAWQCSKMSQCAGYEDTACVPTPDWQTNYRGQIRWAVWWAYVELAPDARHPAYTDGGTRYGSFAEVACHEFGCRTADGTLWGAYGYW